MHSTSPITLTLAALLLAAGANAHGMLVSPNGFGASGMGSVRDYYKVSASINDLRNPNGQLCRGTGRGQATYVNMPSNGGYHSVTVSYSIGAQHIGDCGIEIFDADSPYDRVLVGYAPGPQGCAVPRGNAVTPYFNTGSYPEASSQCRGYVTPGTEHLNDMCSFQWTFQVQRMDQYENCVDINLSINGNRRNAANLTFANGNAVSDKVIDELIDGSILGAGEGPTDFKRADGKVHPFSAKVYERLPVFHDEVPKQAEVKGEPLVVALAKAAMALVKKPVGTA
ncbi:hypothetical protein HDU67_009523 [Dinochytrium kinnereticum]|nr:hypothetical protein HDU67_009523 [Dinochytrium kinnereticum]